MSKTMRFHSFISHIQVVHKMYTHSTHFCHSHLLSTERNIKFSVVYSRNRWYKMQHVWGDMSFRKFSKKIIWAFVWYMNECCSLLEWQFIGEDISYLQKSLSHGRSPPSVPQRRPWMWTASPCWEVDSGTALSFISSFSFTNTTIWQKGLQT